MVDEFPTGREARRRFGWRPYVASMAVSASERRRGIGRELLRAAERTARGWGYRELMLEVAQENDVAVRVPTLLGRPARAASLPRALSSTDPRRSLLACCSQSAFYERNGFRVISKGGESSGVGATVVRVRSFYWQMETVTKCLMRKGLTAI